jgi:beta-aspartyl-peptidase (threonine type)
MTVTASLGSGGGDGYALIVHGGAGDSAGTRLDGQIDGCHRAAQLAKLCLEAGGSALDAVQQAVMYLEDDPRFNAANGGALTRDGTLELDAAIMEGTSLRAGAVCALAPFKNPIAIARAVLDDGRHVLYCADGAANFAREHGFAAVEPAQMITGEARAAWQSWLDDGATAGFPAGTVGAVARDKQGRMAAATSTGGILGKRAGRVGDSPLLGAGTYADDTLGAASATGQGEGIMRIALCARVSAALADAASPGNAAFDGLQLMKARTGALGGLIVIDRAGRIGWARSTSSMAYAASWEKHGIMAGG